MTNARVSVLSYRKYLSGWSLAFVFVCSPLPALSQNTCQPLIDTSVILSVVTEQFYDRQFNGLDWPAEVAGTVESVDCEDSPAQVSERINALLARLDASHTAVYSTQDLDYWGLNSLFHFDGLDAYELAFPGIWPLRQGERWFVSAVTNGSAAEQAGVRVGDELHQINDDVFTPTGFVNGENQLQLSSDGESTRALTITVPQQSVMRAFVDASAASARINTLTADDGRELSIGYYRIWAARDQIQRDFQTTLDEFYEAGINGLIVDLRGGFGGTSADYLAPVRFLLVRKKMPVHFLIDDSVRSGKEMLAAIVRRDKLGTLVGDTTAGQYLAGRMNRLLDDRYFLYVAVDTFPTPDSGQIEGVGVAPDIHVEPCTRYCAGTDPILDASLRAMAAEPPLAD